MRRLSALTLLKSTTKDEIIKNRKVTPINFKAVEKDDELQKRIIDGHVSRSLHINFLNWL